ncbi:MAG: AAA family ATPase [bacterium]|nr:AAA family ATPase [bacterium]
MTDYKVVLQQEIDELKQKVATAAAGLPPEMLLKVNKDIIALERSIELGSYDEKYEKVSKYIDWVLQVPWSTETTDVLDINKTIQVFDEHHYGMKEVKDRFLEYVSVLKLKNQQDSDSDFRAPILMLVGLVGTGKTTFAYSLAEALDRKLVRIPFGGMGSARELRGKSRLFLESEPGKVIKGIAEAGCRNPIILLDEIDRVSEEARMDIMGVLVELLDPAQNHAFVDNYLDYPVNLSHAIFLATANNTGGIATAVMDRMEKISMPSYTDQEKIVIAKKYILPKLLQNAGMTPNQLTIDEQLWPKMTRPLGFDAGIRTLERTLQSVVRKAARIIVEKGYPEVYVTPQNAKIFLPQY